MTDTPGDVAAKLEAIADDADHTALKYDRIQQRALCDEWRAKASDLRAAASMLRECAEREKALREALHEIAKCEIEYSDGLAACYGPPVLSAEQMAATAFAALSLNNSARAK